MDTEPSGNNKIFEVIFRVIVVAGTVFGFLNEFVKMYDNMLVSRLGAGVFFVMLLGYLFLRTRQANQRRWIWMASFCVVGVAFTLLVAWWLWGDSRFIHNPLVYPIEKAGVSSWGWGTGVLSETMLMTRDDIQHSYQLDFNITDQDPAYAGFTLATARRFDITPFRAVRFTMQYSDDQCNILLSIKDSEKKASKVALDPFINYISREQVVEVPLSAFDRNAVDFTSLRWIDFYTDNTLTKGQHRIIVSNFEFIK